MADASQMSQALAYVCAGILYPDGLGKPSITGRQAVIRRGWLLPSDIFTAQNIRNHTDFVTVTMSARKGATVPEPLGRPWQVQARILPTVSVLHKGRSVQIVFPESLAPLGVVGLWYEGALQTTAAYAVTAQDTAESVAAALADQLPNGTVEGALVSVPGVSVLGNVVGYGESVRVSRRQSQLYRVSVWTADASVRDIIGLVLDTALAEKSWISTLDGRQAQLKFVGVEDVDAMQNQAVYRRDYLYELIFDTLQTQWAADMMFGVGTIDAGGQDVGFGAIAPVPEEDVVTRALEAMAAAAVSVSARSEYPGMALNQFGTVVSSTD
ncbi:hypothetical protein BAR24_04400 [Gluconobacter oxydans]|uniref:hypothetical protein n=1 Tax=Gluconobacter thailandicus TaxID=257438 RepID=UPI00029997A2|nr:hypothetical protein [Gluconobacter thailandicus]AFW00511.1 hypothetical protein B932_0916 [Gluconobacter oxydans H24]ANQ40761.1 hypothetical protein BAR24_04400 [Gluconobacter oxydans]